MLSFLLAVTVNSFLFMSFLGISMAHANGGETLPEPAVPIDDIHVTVVEKSPALPEPMAAILAVYKPDADRNHTASAALRRHPCGDRGFDVIIIEQASLNGKPVQVADFNDDDCLQVNYQRNLDAFGETRRPPMVSVVNFADDTGAYIMLDGITIAEVPDGQFMSPDNINLVAV